MDIPSRRKESLIGIVSAMPEELRPTLRKAVISHRRTIDGQRFAMGVLGSAVAEHGRIGEKYILGNRNLLLKEIFDLLEKITGIPSPNVKIPHWIPLTFAALDTGIARITKRSPKVSLESVQMSRYMMYFDASKAVRWGRWP